MGVEELIAKAHAELSGAEPVSRSVLIGGEMVSVVLPPMRGDEWRELRARHLPRPGAFTDQNLGYNVDAVTRDFPKVRIVRESGEADNLTRVGDDGEVRYIWPDTYSAIDGPGLEILSQAIWEMQEYEPQQKMLQAGKALRAGRNQKPSSPGN